MVIGSSFPIVRPVSPGWMMLASLLILALHAGQPLADPSCTIHAQEGFGPELIIGTTDSDEEVEEVIERLERLERSPLNLRSASIEDLMQIPGLSPQSAREVVDCIREDDPHDMEQLLALVDLSPEERLLLQRYARVDNLPESEPVQITFRTRLVRDVQSRRGFRREVVRRVVERNQFGDSIAIDTISLGRSFLGRPEGIYGRIGCEWKWLELGATFEKDPGEPLFYRDTSGYSYASNELVDPRTTEIGTDISHSFGSFASFYGEMTVKSARILVGDFTPTYGQGLIFGRPFSGRKGGNPVRDPYLPGNGLHPYRSSGERYYLRGIGIALDGTGMLPDALSADLFLSRRLLDGTISEVQQNEVASDGQDEFDSLMSVVTSLRDDGLLRTRSDIRHDDIVEERTAGFHTGLNLEKSSTGITAALINYSTPLLLSYRLTSPPLSTVPLVSINSDISLGPLQGFGEIAFAPGNGAAAVLGTSARFAHTDITLHGRFLTDRFISPYGVTFASSMHLQNEQGLYFGFRTRLGRSLRLLGYADFYRYPNGTSDYPFGRSGYDGVIEGAWKVSSAFQVQTRFRQKYESGLSTQTSSSDKPGTIVTGEYINGCRVNLTWQQKESPVDVRFRFEVREWKPEAKPAGDTIGTDVRGTEAMIGYLTYLDLRWQICSSLSAASRFILFDAPRNDVRLYQVEPDLPGRLTSLGPSGSGSRLVLTVLWKISQHLQIGAKVAETIYADRLVISPDSDDEIEGNRSSQIALQIDWRP